jgi:hypothetical protein
MNTTSLAVSKPIAVGLCLALLVMLLGTLVCVLKTSFFTPAKA